MNFRSSLYLQGRAAEECKEPRMMLCHIVDVGIAKEALSSLRHLSRSPFSQVDLCFFENPFSFRQFVKKSTKIISQMIGRGVMHDEPKHRVSSAALMTHER